MTKARELAELGRSVTVHDNRVDFDRQMQVRGITDSAQIQILSTDSAEVQGIIDSNGILDSAGVTTIADNQGLLNSLIFGG